jgi:hypothetical protein
MWLDDHHVGSGIVEQYIAAADNPIQKRPTAARVDLHYWVAV